MLARLARLGVGYYAVVGLALGLYAVLAPRHYFLNFPGAGREWVAHDGPYNEHLMRDYGALNLALGVLAVCALLWWTRPLVVAVALAEIVYALPHAAYHLANPEHLGSGADQVGAIGGVLLGAGIGVALLMSGAGNATDKQPAVREAIPSPTDT